MFPNILLPLGTQYNQIASLIFGIFPNPDHNKKQREKIYVIGNGWASYYFVKNLNKNKYEPIIIAPNKKVLNTPKLVNYLIDSNQKVEFNNPYAKIITDSLEDIDLENKELITKSGSKYPYSKVVLAIGSESNDFNIQGVNEYTYKFKTLQDANLIKKQLNLTNPKTNIYIVGSGITGIELGTKLYTQNQIDGFNKYKISIFEGFDNILPGLNDKTRNDIKDWIQKFHPSFLIHTNTLVKSIEKNQINLANNKENIILNFHQNQDIIIWTGGVRFSGYEKTQLFKTLNKICPIKPRGIDVNLDFSIGPKNSGTNNEIYCLGDMVANAGPPSAQNAKNQAIWLAEYFNRNLDYESIEAYKIISKGKLIHLNDTSYLETEYYSGHIPNFLSKLIDKLVSE